MGQTEEESTAVHATIASSLDASVSSLGAACSSTTPRKPSQEQRQAAVVQTDDLKPKESAEVHCTLFPRENARGTNMNLPTSNNMPGPEGTCPFRQAALTAIEEKETQFVLAPVDLRSRDHIRHMHSFQVSSYPNKAERAGLLKTRMGMTKAEHEVHLVLNSAGITWNDGKKKKGLWKKNPPRDKKQLLADDIVGATSCSSKAAFQVHYFRRGRGKHQEKLKRRYQQRLFVAHSEEEAQAWVSSIQLMVKWHARVPLNASRKIRVVVNPHSGERHGLQIYQTWQPLLELAGIECDMEMTTYGGHAMEIGKTYDPNSNYEAIVFVGGDGTVNEFLNGLLQRPENEWKSIVACTPLSLLSAGTDNAFGKGVGLPSHAAAIYSIIKRKIRPVDAVACQPRKGASVVFACCGVSYGIGADIALESERTRWMGVHRYAWLKLKRSILAPKKHACKIRYVLANNRDDEGKLFTFDELEDAGTNDQHHVERCSAYNQASDSNKKAWLGDSLALTHPASDDRFEGQWQEESGRYITVGVANLHFEAKYTHPSDGKLDLIIVRKGSFKQTVALGLKYILGDPLKSPLMDYKKVKAVVIEQDASEPINFDGEVLEGPGPFRVEVIPGLFRVLSEK